MAVNVLALENRGLAMLLKTSCIAAVFSMALSATVSQQGNAASRASGTLADTVAQLTRQSENWDKAIVQKDKTAIANNMAEDFRQISSSGEVADKEAFVRNITAEGLTIDPYTVEDFNVRVYGDVALLSGRTHMTGHEGGKAFKTQYIYIDIYRRVGGKWLVCSVQTTRLAS
jgi:ketosteroid isomerase-like protein